MLFDMLLDRPKVTKLELLYAMLGEIVLREMLVPKVCEIRCPVIPD
jgi:hypothetical protein